MDLGVTVQAILLVAAGSAGTIVAGKISDARHRRDRDAELDRGAAERRWEVGRDHALAAIALLRGIDEPMIDDAFQSRDWLWGSRDKVLAQVDLIPNASLRHRADWVMRSAYVHGGSGSFVYQEGDGRDYSLMAVTNLIEELGAFARGEEVPATSWLSDYVDRVQTWYEGLTFTCTA